MMKPLNLKPLRGSYLKKAKISKLY